jgi:hypothetical protein
MFFALGGASGRLLASQLLLYKDEYLEQANRIPARSATSRFYNK